jgi:hypothetical protein
MSLRHKTAYSDIIVNKNHKKPEEEQKGEKKTQCFRSEVSAHKIFIPHVDGLHTVGIRLSGGIRNTSEILTEP